MNVESGFLGGKPSPYEADENNNFSDFQPLYESQSGFFRILVGKHAGRKVVIKTLKGDAAGNRVAIAQLRKEFSTLFPLGSPNVAQAYCLTKLADGTPAIEMEWCDGADIRALMGDGLSVPDAVEIVRGVLHGLQAIHMAGIVHRDIKPENVMFDPYRKVVKIIDFGCAYVTGSTVLQGPNGTEGYTPEDKKASGSEPEPKDDLYALGVMTAELASNLKAQTKKDLAVKKQLSEFASRLRDGRFEKAAGALAELEEIGKKKGRARWPVTAVIITAVLTGGIYLLTRSPQQPEAKEEARAHTTKTDTIPSPHPAADNLSEPIEPGQQKPEDQPIQASEVPAKEALAQETSVSEAAPESKTETARPYLNPYSAVSAEDEEAYELATKAGPLLQRAKSNYASPQIKMDAFVMIYCDSVYTVEDMWSKYPRHIEEDDMRELARQLRVTYAPRIEKAFRQQFGNVGSARRREALIEGRFYCSLLAFHRQARPPKKSN